ncbi:MAG TPA: lysylphosphatidylglycerol synthase transmembrane domain-containing protein [Candidatus Omnitrophota bacterium]|nr:lysylphosphatidylglycerol synthase transmembrane domain-containing protein [Candidatus Omnitrophota bacterium]
MKNGLRGKILRFFISFAVLGLVIFLMRDKLHESLGILKSEVRWEWFGFAVVGYFIGLAIVSERIQWVFRVQEIRMKFGECYYLTFVGLFYNLFLPSALGGDVVRAYYAYKHSGKKIESATSILLDRLLGFLATISMAVFGMMYFSKEASNPYIEYAVYGACVVLGFFVVFFASKRFARLFKGLKILVPSEKLKHRLAEVYHAIYGYRHHRGPVLVAILLSFVGQAVFIAVNYLIAVSLGVDINFWKFFILIPVISIVSMAPSIGGLGVREASVLYLFSRYLPAERALALTLLMDILIYSFSVGAGVVYAFCGGLKEQASAEKEMMPGSAN